MAFNYRSGLGHAAAYMVSGRPYLTGSENMGHPGNTHKIEFGAVARSVTVIASDPLALIILSKGQWSATIILLQTAMKMQ